MPLTRAFASRQAALPALLVAALGFAACGAEPRDQAPRSSAAPEAPAETSPRPSPGPAIDPAAIRELRGPTMGSTYHVKFVGSAPTDAVRTIVEAELAAIDATFSNWRPDSELARLNDHASTEPFPVSARLANVLELALAVATATDGAFDPTIKPLTDLYRAAKRSGTALDPVAVAAARERIDHRRVALRAGAVHKARADVELDLDGIVAGAACDAIAAALAPLGLRGAYIEVTGEVRCSGDKGALGPWMIGIVDPRDDGLRDGVAQTMALRDAALCTSGDYRNAIVVDGKVVHHVFDPRSAANPRHAIVSASVLAPSAAVADAIGTALLVTGEPSPATWQRLRQLGAAGALLLSIGRDGELVAKEFEWPAK